MVIRYFEWVAEMGVAPSVGETDESSDNAHAKAVIVLYKMEVIHKRDPWKLMESVKHATLEWINWFNYRRIIEVIGNISPTE